MSARQVGITPMIPNPKNQPLNFEWQKTIREILDIAAQLEYGEIIIKVQGKKPILTEYVIKRKPTDDGEVNLQFTELI